MAWLSCVLISVALFHVTTGQNSIRVVIEEVRLQDGRNNLEGRVEVRVNGVWGTVCDDSWDNQNSLVTCKSVGLSGGETLKNSTISVGTGAIFMDDVQCSGDENHLRDCQFSGLTGSCTHSEDVIVRCQPAGASTASTTTKAPPTPVTQPSNCQGGSNSQANVQLFGLVKGIGYVKVRAPNGTFGFVCDDSWDINAATVVCRELCYNTSLAQPGIKKDLTPQVDNPSIFLDDVKCAGSESTLSNCNHRNWFEYNCASTELAAVSCVQAAYNPPPPPKPILQCRNGDLVAVFNKSRDPNLEPKHFSINRTTDQGCGYSIDNTDPKFMTVKIPFDKCNTSVSQNATHIIYSNTLKMEPTSQTGGVSRSNTFFIVLSCEMARNETVDKEAEPLTQVVTQKTEGHFVITMTIFEDRLFSKPTPSYPFQLDLGEWVNAGVELESVDSRLKLVINNCSAKANQTSDSPTKPLIVDKCSIDSSTMEMYPLSLVKMGLRFQSFVFVNYPTFFVECDVIVCLISEVTSECDRSCNNAKPTPTPSRKRRSVPWEDAGRNRRDVLAAEGGNNANKQVYRVNSQAITVKVHPLSSSTAAAPKTTLKKTTKTPSSTTTASTPTTTTPTSTTTTPSTTTTTLSTTTTTPSTTTTTPSTTTTTATTRTVETTRGSSVTSSTHVPATVITVRATGSVGSTTPPVDTRTQYPRSGSSLQSPDMLVRSSSPCHTAWPLSVVTTLIAAFLCVCLPFYR